MPIKCVSIYKTPLFDTKCWSWHTYQYCASTHNREIVFCCDSNSCRRQLPDCFTHSHHIFDRCRDDCEFWGSRSGRLAFGGWSRPTRETRPKDVTDLIIPEVCGTRRWLFI